MPRAARERQLVAAAERLFAARGYEATSIEDVARAAGVTRPIIYQHFGDKAGLFLACVRHIRQELDEVLTEALEGMDGRPLGEVLERGGDAYYAMLERDPARWVLMLSTTTAVAEELNALRMETVRRIAELGGILDLDLDHEARGAVAHIVSGVGEQLGRWWMLNPDVPRARVVAYFRDFLISGVLRPPTPG